MSVVVRMVGNDGKPVEVSVYRVVLEIEGGQLEVVSQVPVVPVPPPPAPVPNPVPPAPAPEPLPPPPPPPPAPEPPPVQVPSPPPGQVFAPGPVSADGWLKVGLENEMITVPENSTVRWGANDKFITKVVSGGPFKATNEYFGHDPIVGVQKVVELYVVGGGQPAPAPAPQPQPAPAPVVSGTPLAKVGTASFATLGEAAAAGAVIEVQRDGTGPEATVAISREGTNVIVSTAEKRRLKIDGSFRPAWGKGIIVWEGPANSELFVKNLILEGASVPESNGAGIRAGDHYTSLIVEDCEIINNQMGILANANANGTIALKNCKFDRNGQAHEDRRGYSHNIYINQIKRFVMQGGTVTNSAWGHNIKSRAIETFLEGVTTEGASEGRELDLPNGGIVYVKGCTFKKLSNGKQGTLIGIGHEGFAGRTHKFVFENCDFSNVTDQSARVILDNVTDVPVEFINCRGLETGELRGKHTIVK